MRHFFSLALRFCLVSHVYIGSFAVVGYLIFHQRLVVFALSAACDGSVFQAVDAFTFVANYRLAVAGPFQRIVGAAILFQTVGALAVPGYMSAEVG